MQEWYCKIGYDFFFSIFTVRYSTVQFDAVYFELLKIMFGKTGINECINRSK